MAQLRVDGPPRAALLLVVTLLLPGCLLQRTVFGGPHIHDLRFERVALIDLRERPELAEFRTPVEDSWPALLVTVSTTTDLGAFDKLYGYNISPIAAQCLGQDFDPQRRLSIFSQLSDARGILTQRRHDPLPGTGRRAFWIPFPVTTRQGVSGSSATPDGWFVAHDLRRDPVDVCLALRGGAMWGLGYFHSNTAIIPAAAIRAAFEGAGS